MKYFIIGLDNKITEVYNLIYHECERVFFTRK